MIEIKGLRVDDKGDESVGIFPHFWTIEGTMFFEDEEELNDFMKQIQGTFEMITDCPKVSPL